PPRRLLDQRQAVDGIGPLPSERLAREGHLAEIPRIEQGGQEKHDVGVEERRLDGGDLLPLHGITRAGHGTGGCLYPLWAQRRRRAELSPGLLLDTRGLGGLGGEWVGGLTPAPGTDPTPHFIPEGYGLYQQWRNGKSFGSI
ncbi:hypothetical protein THAOC_13854, partial [Thalassiosira oceanica]